MGLFFDPLDPVNVSLINNSQDKQLFRPSLVSALPYSWKQTLQGQMLQQLVCLSLVGYHSRM